MHGVKNFHKNNSTTATENMAAMTATAVMAAMADEKYQYCVKTGSRNNNSYRSHAVIPIIAFPAPQEINSCE